MDSDQNSPLNWAALMTKVDFGLFWQLDFGMLVWSPELDKHTVCHRPKTTHLQKRVSGMRKQMLVFSLIPISLTGFYGRRVKTHKWLSVQSRKTTNVESWGSMATQVFMCTPSFIHNAIRILYRLNPKQNKTERSRVYSRAIISSYYKSILSD